MSIKYIPKVNLRNRCWLATDATGRGRERKEWQKFSVFHLFPIPMLAPSLPVRPIAPHSSVDGPAGPPKWHVVAVAAVALSHCGGALARRAGGLLLLLRLRGRAQRAHTATLFIEFRPRRQRIIFSEKIPLVISRGKLANSWPVMPRTEREGKGNLEAGA